MPKDRYYPHINNVDGGKIMDKNELWQAFAATGNPMLYLLYKQSAVKNNDEIQREA